MIGIDDLDCGMALMANGCDQLPANGISKKSCCENVLITLHTDNEFDTEAEATSPSDLGQYAMPESIVAVYHAPVPYADDYSKYAPPLINSDLRTLFQVFRI